MFMEEDESEHAGKRRAGRACASTLSPQLAMTSVDERPVASRDGTLPKQGVVRLNECGAPYLLGSRWKFGREMRGRWRSSIQTCKICMMLRQSGMCLSKSAS
jgi:hypothetical protein